MKELDLVQTNEERVQIEQKDIKDLEAIEKKEISVQTNEEVQTESKDIKYLEAVEKTEIPVQTNEQIQTENNDIKDLVAIEKTEIPAAKQVRLHPYSIKMQIAETIFLFIYSRSLWL